MAPVPEGTNRLVWCNDRQRRRVDNDDAIIRWNGGVFFGFCPHRQPHHDGADSGREARPLFHTQSYLKLLKERFLTIVATTSKETTHAISRPTLEMSESEERTRVDQRSELFRYYVYMVMRPVEGKMLIR
jgi:hypothetical protein